MVAKTQANIAQALYNDKTNSIADICKTLNISRATLYRYIKVEGRNQKNNVPSKEAEG